MAVDDGVCSSSAEPDASGNLHIRPDWSHVVSASKPPEELILPDYTSAFTTAFQCVSVPCYTVGQNTTIQNMIQSFCFVV